MKQIHHRLHLGPRACLAVDNLPDNSQRPHRSGTGRQ
ncbi:hypothetical protein Ae706Ps2_6368 [Pseudonocardia sp. Ae706_Ps2]|nr:hypothetical protein Ae706Ps2_6368 [Pseudonocardia sp. Ae706_Ps2]